MRLLPSHGMKEGNSAMKIAGTADCVDEAARVNMLKLLANESNKNSTSTSNYLI